MLLRKRKEYRYHSLSLPVPFIEQVKDHIKDRPQYRSVADFARDAMKERIIIEKKNQLLGKEPPAFGIGEDASSETLTAWLLALQAEMEQMKEEIKRELKEELGISIEVNDVALICDSIAPDRSRHIVNICFFCSYDTGEYFLGKEQRLYDFGFHTSNDLQNIQIFPPIKAELKRILLGSENNIYQGKKWINQ